MEPEHGLMLKFFLLISLAFSTARHFLAVFVRSNMAEATFRAIEGVADARRRH
jgi:hypothetical protein